MDVSFPLTPTLSLRERETRSAVLLQEKEWTVMQVLSTKHPLTLALSPKGEREDCRNVHFAKST